MTFARSSMLGACRGVPDNTRNCSLAGSTPISSSPGHVRSNVKAGPEQPLICVEEDDIRGQRGQRMRRCGGRKGDDLELGVVPEPGVSPWLTKIGLWTYSDLPRSADAPGGFFV
jgi:hypothetical protein